MKNRILLFLTFLMMSFSIYGKDIVINNGETLSVDTITLNNKTLLKLRDLSNLLEIECKWNSQDQSVEIKDNKYNVKLYNGKPQMLVNGEVESIDTPPVIENGSTYVPLRVVGDAFGYITGYKDGIINITTRRMNSEFPVETMDEFKECIEEYCSLYKVVIEKMPFSSREEARNVETKLYFLERKLTRNSIFLDGKDSTLISNAISNIAYFVNLTSKDHINYQKYYNEIKEDYSRVMEISDKVIKSNK